MINALAGYEWIISDDFTIELSGKYTLAGGSPYTPIDLEKSAERGNTYLIEQEAYSLRNSDYSRLDFRIDFRQNLSDWSIISYFSIENALNTQNILMRTYDTNNDAINKVYQLGIFPVGGVRIEF